MEQEEEKLQEVKINKKEAKASPLLEKADKETSGSEEIEQIVVTKSSFWERFMLKLSVEEKAIITENIVNEIENTPLYWVQLILSVVIATFGLLQNSVAIIIGAMLLAPMLRPIKGLAFGITTGQSRYLWKAFGMQFVSIVLTVFTAYVVSLMIPLKIETPEIIARTAPNLLDLLIAITAGLVAILSLYFKKLSESIAGVAMAASIMPPLAVTGIELALNNTRAVGGSFFLFLTNLFAILAVGVIVFMMYGFFPAQKSSLKRSLRIGSMLFLLLFFISFPLLSSLTNITDEIEIRRDATRVIEEYLDENLPAVQLSQIDVIGFDDRLIELTGTLKVPTGVDIMFSDKSKMGRLLIADFEQNVILELQLIPILSLGIDNVEEFDEEAVVEEDLE